MAEVTTTRFCATCARDTAHRRTTTNDVLHLLLTLATLGLWLPVWLALGLLAATNRSYCSVCGTPYRAREARRRQRELRDAARERRRA